MAVGSALVGGSAQYERNEEARFEVLAWDAESLGLRVALPQPAGARVWSLLAARGEVWGGVGSDVVLWGRD